MDATFEPSGPELSEPVPVVAIAKPANGWGAQHFLTLDGRRKIPTASEN